MKHIKLFEDFLIQENNILLRKMTRKSKFDFGIYHNMTVEDVLKLRKYDYLIWCYYNYELITFMDDILDEIGITPEYRIAKPGKDEGMEELFTNNNINHRQKDKKAEDAINKEAERKQLIFKSPERVIKSWTSDYYR